MDGARLGLDFVKGAPLAWRPRGLLFLYRSHIGGLIDRIKRVKRFGVEAELDAHVNGAVSVAIATQAPAAVVAAAEGSPSSTELEPTAEETQPLIQPAGPRTPPPSFRPASGPPAETRAEWVRTIGEAFHQGLGSGRDDDLSADVLRLSANRDSVCHLPLRDRQPRRGLDIRLSRAPDDP